MEAYSSHSFDGRRRLVAWSSDGSNRTIYILAVQRVRTLRIGQTTVQREGDNSQTDGADGLLCPLDPGRSVFLDITDITLRRTVGLSPSPNVTM